MQCFSSGFFLKQRVQVATDAVEKSGGLTGALLSPVGE